MPEERPVDDTPLRRFRPIRAMLRVCLRGLKWGGGFVLLLIFGFSFLNPPTTIYMASETVRLGGVDHEWVAFENIAPVMARSAVAAEDANFCAHWGFDLDAIRDAIEDGARRGGSTISQQVAKNVFLWHGTSRSERMFRKSLEALVTPLVELVWSKRRVIEVYLNVAEFDTGVFGVQAAARHYYGVDADMLSAIQAARLAAVLPSPKTRSASKPSAAIRRRAAQIADGAATIRKDGRAACFED